ncbi:MAG: hypothetical protein JXA57_12090 [Armatimonadetes bacterium]|nr:hypothetical protein [Armatimonadota bacterium]
MRVKIEGDELRVLRILTFAMADSFGLDARIEAYRGMRPIQLHRWDLDCLVDVLANEIKGVRGEPGHRASEMKALRTLHERLTRLRDKAYADLERGKRPPR